MYNVLEKVRSGMVIEGKDKEVYEKGFIGILKQLHDEIDEATADAYGWPHDLSDNELLFRLVELNAQRADDERQGEIRWLRPEYQNPEGKRAEADATSGTLALADAPEKADKPAWPPTLPEQVAGVREALQALGEASPQQVAQHFKRGRAKTVEPLLETLAALGQARKLDDGRFANGSIK